MKQDAISIYNELTIQIALGVNVEVFVLQIGGDDTVLKGREVGIMIMISCAYRIAFVFEKVMRKLVDVWIGISYV